MIEKVFDNVVFVVVSPRLPTSTRSTGGGIRDGSQLQETKQMVLTDEVLKPLAAIKTRSRRLMLRFGTPIDYLSAWAVPKARWAALKAEVDLMKTEWEIKVGESLSSMDVALDRLCAQYPHQEESIRAHALTQTAFRKAAIFVHGAYHLSQEQIVDGDALHQELSNMSIQVAQDLGKLIKDGKRSVNADDEYDATTFAFLQVLTEKAQSFAFVDPALARLATQFTQVVGVLPTKGRIAGLHGKLISKIYGVLEEPSIALRDGFDIGGTIEAINRLNTAPAIVTPIRKPRSTGVSTAGKSDGEDGSTNIGPNNYRNNPVCI